MTDARTEWDAIAAQIPDINSLPESDGVTMFENILSEWALKHGPALLTTITDLRAEVSRLTGEINAHKDAIAEAQGIIAELKGEALRTLPTVAVDGWEAIAKDRAYWLLEAVACCLQDRRFLRGEPEYDEDVGEAILINAEKAIRVAIQRVICPLPTQPSE